jgi:hypothetical protein
MQLLVAAVFVGVVAALWRGSSGVAATCKALLCTFMYTVLQLGNLVAAVQTVDVSLGALPLLHNLYNRCSAPPAAYAVSQFTGWALAAELASTLFFLVAEWCTFG